MKRLILCLVYVCGLLLQTSTLKAQATNCGSYYFEALMNSNDANYALRKQATETAYQDSTVAHHQDSLLARASDISYSIIKIPIVMHLIGTNAQASVSFFAAQQMITDLNNLYRKQLNTPGDGDGVDTQIEFCLAIKDPSNFPSVGVVNYGSGSLGPYQKSDDATIKNFSHWDPSKYLNIWICDLSTSTDKAWGSRPDVYYTNSNTALKILDGIVCDMGNFNAKLLAHEIGHWLNLKHTYGDDGSTCGSDECSDTPFCTGSAATFFCSSINHQCSAANGNSSDIRLLENYMDDSDGSCKNMFTLQQKVRMRNTLSIIRNGILNSNAICPPSCNDGVQNGNETGMDCGGPCDACDPGPTGTSICLTVRFKVNGVDLSSGQILKVCNNSGDIMLSQGDCGANYSTWMLKQVTVDHLSSSDPAASSCTRPKPLLQPNRWQCNYSKIFLSVMECDATKNLIPNTEVSAWYIHNDAWGPINVHDFLQGKNATLQSGHYYRILLGSNKPGGGGWGEEVHYIQVIGPVSNLSNATIHTSQLGDDITITDCTISAPSFYSVPLVLNIVAKNSISIYPNSVITAGALFLDNYNCSSINNYRTANTSDNVVVNDSQVTTDSRNMDSMKGFNLEALPEQKLILEVVPNPFEGDFKLMIKNADEYPSLISVNNLLGNKIKEYTFPDAYQFDINMSDATPGMYIVKVIYKGKTYSKKVIKK